MKCWLFSLVDSLEAIDDYFTQNFSIFFEEAELVCKLWGEFLVKEGLAIDHRNEVLYMLGFIWLECFEKAKQRFHLPVFGNIFLIFSKDSNKLLPIAFSCDIFGKIVPKLEDNFFDRLMLLKTSFPNINNFFDFTHFKFWYIKVLKHFTTFLDYFRMLIVNENYFYQFLLIHPLSKLRLIAHYVTLL